MIYLFYLQQVGVLELSSLILDVGGLGDDAISKFDLLDGLQLCMLQSMNCLLSLMGIIFPSSDVLF